MASNEGGCSCGEVRYRLSSDPLFVHCCHCLNCQRQTGSAFVINALIEAERVELLAGEPRPVAVRRDSGDDQVIWRCPTCQVALFSTYGWPAVRFARATIRGPGLASLSALRVCKRRRKKQRGGREAAPL